MGHQRGGGRRGWGRIRRALAPEYHDPEPDPATDAETPAPEPGSAGQETQASLDQVLRHAAQARDMPHGDNA